MKKKIAILGCENSHANSFLKFIRDNEQFSDIEVFGVYSSYDGAAEKLASEYGVRVMQSADEAVGKIDALVITARHGAHHYPLAKPYIESGIPMFIDKPTTISEQEAVEFMRQLRAHGVRITGGSSLKMDNLVLQLKADATAESNGKTIGGLVRAPYSPKNDYGDFYFYAPHLVEMVCEIFGKYPLSVKSYKNGEKLTVVFRYSEYDVVGVFVANNYHYYAYRMSEGGIEGGSTELSDDNDWFMREFCEFKELALGGEQRISYEDFISPVFIMNAIERSLNSGNEETVNKFTI